MTEYDKIKAAFDYLISASTYVKPIAFDEWRFRSSGEPAPTYVETRSQSILKYGLGTCEDYSAAFVLLLEAMGMEAEYVPGPTYTTWGGLCDHAWIVVKVDGAWYHLDVQLEDGISRNGIVNYRYFMKSDATMRGSHIWEQDLIDSGRLLPDQNEDLARDYIPPTCPQDYQTPSPSSITSIPSAVKEDVEAELQKELRAYEEQYGALTPIDIDRLPPLFGRHRGYNREGNPDYDEQENLDRDVNTVLIPTPRGRDYSQG